MKHSICIDCHFRTTKNCDSWCKLQNKTSHSIEYPDCIFVLKDHHIRFLSNDEIRSAVSSTLEKSYNTCRFSDDSLARHREAVVKLIDTLDAGVIVRSAAQMHLIKISHEGDSP